MSKCKGKVTLVLNQTEAQQLARLLESLERFVVAQTPPEPSSMARWRGRLLARLAAKRSLIWERFILPTTVSEVRFLAALGTPAQRESLRNQFPEGSMGRAIVDDWLPPLRPVIRTFPRGKPCS